MLYVQAFIQGDVCVSALDIVHFCVQFIAHMQDFKEVEIKQKEQERIQLSFSTFMHPSYTKSRGEEFQDIETIEVEPDDVDTGVKVTNNASKIALCHMKKRYI